MTTEFQTELPTMARRGRPDRQAVVVEVLQRQDGFRSALELYADLRQCGSSIGLTTVYRHLNLLVSSGRADVVVTRDGEAQFRLCGAKTNGLSGGRAHHHHLLCRACGKAVEVEAPTLEVWATSVAEAAGYTDVTHTLEVFGLCPDH
ncbi:transcriptional repressor [Acidothermaceae bacterium B102]|nr:transcriptional repressor [Acidothermaceae bacterium B102]